MGEGAGYPMDYHPFPKRSPLETGIRGTPNQTGRSDGPTELSRVLNALWARTEIGPPQVCR